jgi:hypothetical protein
MKKIYVLFGVLILLFTGCSDIDIESLKEDSKNTLNNVKDSIKEEVTFDKKISKEKFYDKINEIRLENDKSEIEISPNLEKNADECAKLDFFEECEIKARQEGVNWEIPWDSNVEGCGFAQSSSTNINCLIKSLENDKNTETRIYDYILSKNKIGLGIMDKGDSISYSITLE